jgi:hypothetical protein
MGCPGCLPTAQERERQIQKVSKLAKADAVSTQKLYVVYFMADFQVSYMEAEAAKLAGIQPIAYISPFR